MELAQNNTVSSGEKLGALPKDLSVEKKIDAAVAQNKPEIKKELIIDNADPSATVTEPYAAKVSLEQDGLDFVKY